jgi:hypothetical protein
MRQFTAGAPGFHVTFAHSEVRDGSAPSAVVSSCSCILRRAPAGDLVTFAAVAAGPPDATQGPLEFVNDRAWHVVLSSALVHVGAVYLNQNIPISGAQNTSCILPGTYVAQVTTGMDVNILSPELQPFPAPGTASRSRRSPGRWLAGGDQRDR